MTWCFNGIIRFTGSRCAIQQNVLQRLCNNCNSCKYSTLQVN